MALSKNILKFLVWILWFQIFVLKTDFSELFGYDKKQTMYNKTRFLSKPLGALSHTKFLFEVYIN
jgi:hypothetical protein